MNDSPRRLKTIPQSIVMIWTKKKKRLHAQRNLHIVYTAASMALQANAVATARLPNRMPVEP
jgi:hypothetical protein